MSSGVLEDRPVAVTRLDNGVRIVTQYWPGARSAAVGVWLTNGSRYERPEQAGYAHLLEHMFFKGTPSYDRIRIARLTDLWGGHVNAHTGRELTALHGIVPADDVVALAHMLVEMLLQPRFGAADLEAERGVVLQEIAAVDEVPEEAVEEHALALAWPNHPLGAPILGREDSIRACTVDMLHAYHRELIAGTRIVVSAVGAVDPARLADAIRPLLIDLPAGQPRTAQPAAFRGGSHHAQRDCAQSHLVWAAPAPALTSTRFAQHVIANQILGGGVASRLFQELREARGLVYDVRAWLEAYADCGLWLIHTACDPERVQECETAVDAILAELALEGPRTEEVEDVATHLRSALLLEADEMESSMERLARETIYFGRPRTLDERLAPLGQVDKHALRAHVAHAWREPLRLAWHPQA